MSQNKDKLDRLIEVGIHAVKEHSEQEQHLTNKEVLLGVIVKTLTYTGHCPSGRKDCQMFDSCEDCWIAALKRRLHISYVSSGGYVYIPSTILKEFELSPGDTVIFSVSPDGDHIKIEKEEE